MNSIFQIINYRNKLLFLYDPSINSIIEITLDELKALYQIKNATDSFPSSNILTRLMTLGYLKDEDSFRIEHPLTPYIHSIVDHYTSNVIMQVTQNCNFSCRYCSFANQYGPIRNHAEVNMTPEVARKTISFLKEKSSHSKTINIHFYGGEPLLNYGVIKESILFSEKILEEKYIQFRIVTNLSFLTKPMLDFFIEHNVFLTVSLDGPREVHNKYRKFAYSGSGSFDKIYNNLKLIYEEDINYFKTNVSINAVIDPASDLEEIQMFFENDYLLEKLRVTYNHMEKEDNDIYFSQSNDQRVQLNSKYVNYLLCNMMDSNNRAALFSEFDNINNLTSNLCIPSDEIELPTEYSTKNNLWHHNGPCMAGYRKLFVNVSGRFFPCEKVNELNPEMSIGDINSGYNYEHIEKQLNIARITSNECRRCWAKHLCFSCQKTVDDSNMLSKRKKLLNCEIQKKNILFDLKIKCILDKLKEIV